MFEPPKKLVPGRRKARRRVSPRTAWNAAGLLILGVLAAGMAAFPGVTLSVFSPIRGVVGFVWRTGLSGVDAVHGAGQGGIRMLESSTRLAREKAELQKKLDTAGGEGAMREEEIRELVRLRRLLNLRETISDRVVTARIIGGDPSALFSTLILDRGGEDGVREGQPVASSAGAVGRILSVGPDYAVAMWLCDPRSRIAAYVQRTRVLGVLSGTGAGCELRYLSAGDDVQVGDRILTAGRGSIFPKGILVGTVTELRKDGLSVSAVVAPSVNVRKLEEVLVISRGSPLR